MLSSAGETLEAHRRRHATPTFADPVEVRVSGAILFVLDVERFEKV